MVTIGAETMRVSAALTVIRKKRFLSRLFCYRGGVGSFKHSWTWCFGKVHLLWRRNDDIYEVGRGAQLDNDSTSSRSVSYFLAVRAQGKRRWPLLASYHGGHFCQEEHGDRREVDTSTARRT